MSALSTVARCRPQITFRLRVMSCQLSTALLESQADEQQICFGTDKRPCTHVTSLQVATLAVNSCRTIILPWLDSVNPPHDRTLSLEQLFSRLGHSLGHLQTYTRCVLLDECYANSKHAYESIKVRVKRTRQHETTASLTCFSSRFFVLVGALI